VGDYFCAYDPGIKRIVGDFAQNNADLSLEAAEAGIKTAYAR